MSENLDELIIQWNIQYRYDRRWRKKYNIPFGSKEHLEASQIDIYFDIKEDILFEKLEKEYLESKKDKQEYEKTGKFLKERKLSQKDEDALYKKIKLSL